MYRTKLCIVAVAVASACGRPSLSAPRDPAGGRPVDAAAAARDLPAAEPEIRLDDTPAIDRRAELLTVRGRWEDAIALVERALDAARARGDRAGQARMLVRRGRITSEAVRHRGGDAAPARADLEAAAVLARGAGDAPMLAEAIDALALARFFGWFSSADPVELAEADRQFHVALALRAPGDDRALAASHFHVGLVHQMRGEIDAAYASFSRAEACATRAAAPVEMAEAARHLGYLAQLRHDLATAEQRYARSLALREQMGPGPSVPPAQIALAELRYRRDGDAVRALALLERAREGAAAVRSVAYVAIARAAIARVERDRGRDDEAACQLRAAIAVLDEIHSGEGIPELHEQLALIELARGDASTALATIDRGLARRRSPRLAALRAVAGMRTDDAAPSTASDDPVVAARRALAAGDPAAALDAALRGDDPDTLLLAARAVGPAAFDRAIAAAAALSRGQALRLERALRGAGAETTRPAAARSAREATCSR